MYYTAHGLNNEEFGTPVLALQALGPCGFEYGAQTLCSYNLYVALIEFGGAIALIMLICMQWVDTVRLRVALITFSLGDVTICGSMFEHLRRARLE
jgi:hypothetical protein